MLQATQELKRVEWSVEELDALEAIELPAREAMTTCTSGTDVIGLSASGSGSLIGTSASGTAQIGASASGLMGASASGNFSANVGLAAGSCGCS